MPVFTVPFDDFAGLDLTSAANETAGAIDLLNVDFDAAGRLRSRDGYTQLSAGSGDQVRDMAQTGISGDFITLAGTRARGINNAGAVIASSAVLAAPPINLSKLGTPAATYVYAGTGDALGHTMRWDGAAFAYPVTGFSAYVTGVTPWDNRLILAHENSPTTNPHRVRFSDPGVPDTFGANNWVDLTPGDNQQISAVCTWRNLVFVFKQSRFYVFYGVSADATGQPIFNYRTIDAGVGIPIFVGGVRAGGAVGMGDGVYFVNEQGVWRTTGGPPEKVSQPIDQIYSGHFFNSYFLGDHLSTSAVPFRYHNKLILAMDTSPERQFVYDQERGTWTFWTLPGLAFLEMRYGTTVPNSIQFAGLAGTINRTTTSATTDNGAAISSRYRSPFIPLDWRGRTIRSGIHGVDKTVRESMLEGFGTVTYTLSNQWTQSVSLPTGRSIVMGTSPQVTMARDRSAVRGRMFSWQVSSTTPWLLETLSWNVHAYQAAGEESEIR